MIWVLVVFGIVFLILRKWVFPAIGAALDTRAASIASSIDSAAKLREEGVSPEQLALAKEHIKGSLTLSLESTSSRMIRLGRNEFALGRDVAPEEIEERVDAVAAKDIQELAQELLTEEKLGLCVLGPVDESAIDRRRFAA